MLYTVGLIARYEAALDGGAAIKRGPHRRADGRDDPGGWVWRTAEEARAYLVARGALGLRGVYGVVANWENDTREVPGEPTRCLNRDARVVRI